MSPAPPLPPGHVLAMSRLLIATVPNRRRARDAHWRRREEIAAIERDVALHRRQGSIEQIFPVSLITSPFWVPLMASASCCAVPTLMVPAYGQRRNSASAGHQRHQRQIEPDPDKHVVPTGQSRRRAASGCSAKPASAGPTGGRQTASASLSTHTCSGTELSYRSSGRGDGGQRAETELHIQSDRRHHRGVAQPLIFLTGVLNRARCRRIVSSSQGECRR